MKVLAINGSPLMDKGNTSLILSPFLEGMREAGAEVELFHIRKLNIGGCKGDYACWHRTPGECSQVDDMQMLLPKLREADVWVLASPLYVDGLAAPMKNLLDRSIPLYQPFIEIRDGRCAHPRREGLNVTRFVLVSNCGFWELDNFDTLVGHMRRLCQMSGMEFSGALLRPHGPALRAMKAMGLSADDVFAAAREAGRQLVEEGCMSAETLKAVSRELVPLQAYVQFANNDFQRLLDRRSARADRA